MRENRAVPEGTRRFSPRYPGLTPWASIISPLRGLDFAQSFHRANSKPTFTRSFSAPEFLDASAKAHDQSRSFSRSAGASLPPHKCGGFHQETWIVNCSSRPLYTRLILELP